MPRAQLLSAGVPTLEGVVKIAAVRIVPVPGPFVRAEVHSTESWIDEDTGQRESYLVGFRTIEAAREWCRRNGLEVVT